MTTLSPGYLFLKFYSTTMLIYLYCSFGHPGYCVVSARKAILWAIGRQSDPVKKLECNETSVALPFRRVNCRDDPFRLIESTLHRRNPGFLAPEGSKMADSKGLSPQCLFAFLGLNFDAQ